MKKLEVKQDMCIGCGACISIDGEDFKFDEVKFYFMDSKVEWDVIVDWDGSYYTAGSDELKYEQKNTNRKGDNFYEQKD